MNTINSKTQSDISDEGRSIFVMLQDQLTAQRMALSWLMAHTCPEEARQWLAVQQSEIESSPNLSEIAIELKELAENLDEIVRQRG
jgi:hypothetical protein